MSRGIGGSARIVMQDATAVVYEYAPYNLNIDQYRNAGHVYDGVITIMKSALIEAERARKEKMWPRERNLLVTKHNPHDLVYSAFFGAGLIDVENSLFCWNILPNGCGEIAAHLVYKIFSHYLENGEAPEYIGYHV